MDDIANANGQMQTVKIATAWNPDWKELLQALNLPSENIISFSLSVGSAVGMQHPTLTIEKHLTEPELAALVAYVKEHPRQAVRGKILNLKDILK